MGPAPITDQQLATWASLKGEMLTREEVQCLFAMDRVYRKEADAFANMQKKRKEAKNE